MAICQASVLAIFGGLRPQRKGETRGRLVYRKISARPPAPKDDHLTHGAASEPDARDDCLEWASVLNDGNVVA